MIRTARTRAGLTQAELARRAGMARSVVNAYEHGTREPGADTLVRLIEAAGSTVLIAWPSHVDAAGSSVSLTNPVAVDAARNAAILEQVLDLAERLPSRRRGRLMFPPWRTVR